MLMRLICFGVSFIIIYDHDICRYVFVYLILIQCHLLMTFLNIMYIYIYFFFMIYVYLYIHRIMYYILMYVDIMMVQTQKKHRGLSSGPWSMRWK